MPSKRKSDVAGLKQSKKQRKNKVEAQSYEFPPDICAEILCFIFAENYQIDYSTGYPSCKDLFNIITSSITWYLGYKSETFTRFKNIIHAKKWEKFQGFMKPQSIESYFKQFASHKLLNAETVFRLFAFPRNYFCAERTLEGYLEGNHTKEYIPLYLAEFRVILDKKSDNQNQFRCKFYLLPWHQSVGDIDENFKHSLEPCIRVRTEQISGINEDSSIYSVIQNICQDYYFGDAFIVGNDAVISSFHTDFCDKINEESQSINRIAAAIDEDCSKYDSNGEVFPLSKNSIKRNKIFLAAHQALAILKDRNEYPCWIPWVSKNIPLLQMQPVELLQKVKNEKEDWLNETSIRKNFAKYNQKPKDLVAKNICNRPNHVACVEKNAIRIMDYKVLSYYKRNIEWYSFDSYVVEDSEENMDSDSE